MKILYLTDAGPDYLSDDVLYGLRTLLGADLVDYPREDVLYGNSPVRPAAHTLYGAGFHFEGFGLPPLDAMACGAPLVTASTTSLPEVCSDAALLVDPADVPAIADALVELTRTPSPRDELRTRGLQRAEQYTWRRAADAMLQLYGELA